eukprot:NODE_108_length_19701_cov_0.369452.p14 type:complete len:123 gc:universal NODE_108_length_19701_cov_0.369452:455-87(-)
MLNLRYVHNLLNQMDIYHKNPGQLVPNYPDDDKYLTYPVTLRFGHGVALEVMSLATNLDRIIIEFSYGSEMELLRPDGNEHPFITNAREPLTRKNVGNLLVICRDDDDIYLCLYRWYSRILF